ncbi:hypothetical protein PCA31118_00031 [Pandoraea captiosa]|uniref:Mor transcription activator domain-containing protein n=1 Tax=Pandoraea captiosa TaxID=2508302 RepID=A0A5E4ZHH8_9BURK|nr:Mor transcription activator family protein [Pandoraea captiosa]VVE59835.1 hypothetical protein PCA31118_00031 [Pandoraea captiosa]
MKLENVTHLLPEAAQTIVRVVGLVGAARLIEQLGGTTFPVALRKSRLGEIRYEMLAEVVGTEAADAMTEHFGGDTLYIPRCTQAMRELMHREIRREFDRLTGDGTSALQAVARLAVKFKLADRTIWRVLKRPDAEAMSVGQTSLF